MLKYIGAILFVLVCVAGFYGCRQVFYGSWKASCPYTEQILSVPALLAKGKLIVDSNLAVVEGTDPEYGCLKEFGKFQKQILGRQGNDATYSDGGYYAERGLKMTSLEMQEAEFQVEQVIAVYKNGLAAIDSGRGPIHYLILKNKDGVRFKFTIVFLGANEEDHFMKFVLADESQLLDYSNFRDPNNGSFSFRLRP